MNRVQLVQVIVILMAIILGYQTINFFGFFVANAVSNLISQRDVADSFTFSYGVMALLFAVSMFVFLNNAAKITLWIVEKVQLDENIRLSFSDKNILYAVLLFLSLGSLLKSFPILLYQLFEMFIKGAGGSSSSSALTNPYRQINYAQWIEAILAFILLLNVKPVVNYFHSKINPEDPHALEAVEDFESTNQ